MPYENLTRTQITHALRRLGELPGYPGNYGNIRFLVRKMGITSVKAAETIHDKFFPHDVLSDTAKEVVHGAIQTRQS